MKTKKTLILIAFALICFISKGAYYIQFEPEITSKNSHPDSTNKEIENVFIGTGRSSFDKVASNCLAEQFRKDYNYITAMIKGKWEPTVSSKTIFVFNSNSTNDVHIYLESGNKLVYSVVGNIKENSIDGFKYQAATLLTENGDEYQLKLFNDSQNGLYIVIDQETVLQYHN